MPEAPKARTPDAAEHSTQLMGGRYPEVTWSAVLFGLFFGAVMNAAIAYSGLKIGFTIVGSAIAAVLGFGVLRGLLRRGSILEVNIAQTVASAVNTPNSGVIFTVPVLWLLGWSLGPSDLDFWLITLACVAGAILGGAFIVPLRKQMIEVDRLRFPSAVGVAVILKSPGAGSAKSLVLLAGIAVSMLIYAPAGLPDLGGPGYQDIGWRMSVPASFGPGDLDGDGGEEVRRWLDSDAKSVLPVDLDRDRDGAPDLLMTKDRVDVGRFLGLPAEVQVIFAIAPFAIGAGFLSGKAGLLVLAGGILAFFVLNPLAYRLDWAPPGLLAHEVPGAMFQAVNRPLGIGLLLGGAMMGILAALPAIRAALGSIAKSGKSKLGSDELGMKTLVGAAAAALVLLFVAADFVENRAFNPRCPITLEAPEVSDATEEGVLAELAPEAPEFARVNDDVEPVSYRSYRVGFATEEAKRVWGEDWDDGQRDAFLASSNAKPGVLSGMPSHLRALLIALIGAGWIWFAGIIIAQCTGMTDWSPISGMSLLTVVLVLTLLGSGAVLGAVLIGASLCVAITCASDMMGDLKTGHLVGSQPRRQQIVELIATGIGPIITMAVLVVITQVNLKGGGPPIGPGTDTTAPQAQALQAVILGVQGGEMPYALYGFGSMLGLLLGLGSFAGLGVLVGLSMFLPFFYIATYGIGCVLQIVLSRWKGARWCENWGVPFAAGLIVGEAVLALIFNSLILGGVGAS
ncbi:MAG: hypothetical protein GC161_11160 [Planctomycetaceae bacterium]|nr:hypothetical protein [Planctomycetaceae bacterium]